MTAIAFYATVSISFSAGASLMALLLAKLNGPSKYQIENDL